MIRIILLILFIIWFRRHRIEVYGWIAEVKIAFHHRIAMLQLKLLKVLDAMDLLE